MKRWGRHILLGACMCVAGLFWVSSGAAMMFSYHDGLFTIRADQVPIRQMLNRIAEKTRDDIYIIHGGEKERKLSVSIEGETAAETLKDVLRDFSYAVVYNVGREGRVFFWKDDTGQIPLGVYQHEERHRVSAGGREDTGRGRTEKQEKIDRIKHFIANLERRIESGRADAVYNRQIRERNPETVTHDREKLKDLKEELKQLQSVR